MIEGIQNINLMDILYAKNLDYKIKLLSISEIIKNKLMERVHPCLILKNSYIAKIDGVLNAVVVDGLPIGKSVLQGEGAGPGPTSSALISDLCSILKGDLNYPFGISSKSGYGDRIHVVHSSESMSLNETDSLYRPEISVGTFLFVFLFEVGFFAYCIFLEEACRGLAMWWWCSLTGWIRANARPQ